MFGTTQTATRAPLGSASFGRLAIAKYSNRPCSMFDLRRLEPRLPGARHSFPGRGKDRLPAWIDDRDDPVGTAFRRLHDRVVRRAGRVDDLDLAVVAQAKHRRRLRQAVAEGLTLPLGDFDAYRHRWPLKQSII